MLWWGVVCGALLVAALAGRVEALLPGAFVGLLAASWLREAVRAEVRRTLRQAEQEAARVQQAARRFATPEHLQQAPQPQPTPPQQAPQPAHQMPPAQPTPKPAAAAAPVEFPELPMPAPAAPLDEVGADAGRAWGQPEAFWGRRNAPAQGWADALAGLRALVFGGNTLVRVGAAILFIGLAFLLRYAAQRGLLPLPLRLAGSSLCYNVLHGACQKESSGFFENSS